MKKLTAIINKLTPWEGTQLCNHYKQDGKRETTLRLRLFNLIVKNPKITGIEAAQKIYKKKPDAAFSNLKRRLIDDILDLLIAQNSQSLYNYRLSQVKHDCQKKMLAAKIIIRRGEHDIGSKILENLLKTAEKYELFNEAIDIRRSLITTKGVREGVEKIDFYFQDIEKDLQSLNDLISAEKIYSQISFSNKFKISRKKATQALIEDQIDKFDSITKEKDQIRKIYYRSLAHYYNENKDFKRYLDVIEKYQELVKSGQILHSKGNVAWANMSQIEVYIHLKQYEDAIEFSKKTLKLLSKNKSNRVFTLRLVFTAYFNNKQYKEATATIQDAYQERLVKSNPLEKARFDFFAACVAFLEDDIDAARSLLQDSSAIVNKDSTGWLLGYKILAMMIAIKGKDYYLLSIQLDSFIKLINNHKEAKTERARLIHKILKIYNKENFNKNQTLIKTSNHFDSLKKGKDEYYWDPTSYELIRFEQWFLSL